MKYFIFTIVIFLTLENFVFAEEQSIKQEAPQSLSLKDAQDIAIKNHPKMISSDYSIKAAGERVTIKRSAYLPQITGNAVRTFANPDTRIAATNGISNPTIIERGSVGIGVSQLITDFGRTSDLIAASKLQLKAEKENADFTCSSILLDVNRAYYNLLRAEALEKVAEDTLKSRQVILERISALRDAKMKSDLDLSIANQVVGEAKLLKLKAESGLDEAQAILSDALGYSEPKQFALSDNITIISPPTNLEPLIQNALQSNPELAAITDKKAAARKLANADNKSSYPTINAIGYAGNTPFRSANQKINPNYAAAGINVTIPFFTGGRINAEGKESDYKAKIEEENLLAKRNQLLRDIKIAFNNTQNTFQNIELANQLLKNANKTYELTKARYEIGKSSIVDLSQAQLTKTQAEISVANAKYEYLTKQSILQYQVGDGELLTSCSKIN